MYTHIYICIPTIWEWFIINVLPIFTHISVVSWQFRSELRGPCRIIPQIVVDNSCKLATDPIMIPYYQLYL